MKVDRDEGGQRQRWTEMKVDRDKGGWRQRWMETKVDGDKGGRRQRWMETKVDGDKGGRRQRWKETKVDRDKASPRDVGTLDPGMCGHRMQDARKARSGELITEVYLSVMAGKCCFKMEQP
ncbi:hypothetical protein BDP27DRAFT_1370004 [Rhodocollybia butyracea]|uniref:Uncharacterized protein n=1 Tax=Rhodocollybia butyracea TaxID=206335 RepID=A0A9P5PCX4_9AGAR|nr:hypothetical protein BDP27DRAFT_1370004 [Rhodocollybia butyracea]